MLSLIVFIVVVTANAVGLLLDLYLLAAGRLTITERVAKRPALGVLIVAWQCIGAIALALHFQAI